MRIAYILGLVSRKMTTMFACIQTRNNADATLKAIVAGAGKRTGLAGKKAGLAGKEKEFAVSSQLAAPTLSAAAAAAATTTTITSVSPLASPSTSLSSSSSSSSSPSSSPVPSFLSLFFADPLLSYKRDFDAAEKKEGNKVKGTQDAVGEDKESVAGEGNVPSSSLSSSSSSSSDGKGYSATYFASSQHVR